MTDHERRLEGLLEALLDERQIARLMYDYIEACDHVHDAKVIASFFTEDAVWEGGNRYVEWGRSEGRQAIEDQFSATPGILPFTLHWLTNPRISVAADRGSAVGRWEVLQAATFGHANTPVWVAARYHNDFARTPTGWRIRYLRYSDVFVTPFAEGWVETPYVSPFPPAGSNTSPPVTRSSP